MSVLLSWNELCLDHGSRPLLVACYFQDFILLKEKFSQNILFLYRKEKYANQTV